MMWAFQRRGEHLHCEVRRVADGEAYEFVLARPDGVEEVERFDDPALLIERSVTCLERLREDGWKPVSSAPAF